MRSLADRPRIERFLERLGELAGPTETRVYLTGGATAVLLGWRPSTIDVDLKPVPDHDALLRALPRLKEEIEINVELASPDDFVPALPGWTERSPFIDRVGSVSFFHYDPYGQALSKLERHHAKDLDDVEHMRAAGLVEPDRLLELFGVVESELFRYPAVDPATLRRTLEDWVASHVHGS